MSRSLSLTELVESSKRRERKKGNSRAAVSVGGVSEEIVELQARCPTLYSLLSTTPVHAWGCSSSSCSFYPRVPTPALLLLISLAHFYRLPPSLLPFLSALHVICHFYSPLTAPLLPPSPLLLSLLFPSPLSSASFSSALRHFALASISLLFQQIQSICCINISSQYNPSHSPFPFHLLGGVALRKLCCK